MQLKKFLTILPLLASTSGCSWFKPEIVTVPQLIVPNIQIAEHPKKVQLNKVKFYVVVDENLEEFKQKITKDGSEFVFVAVTVRDYENLALNVGEIKRYMEQQKEIILYYERSITELKDETN